MTEKSEKTEAPRKCDVPGCHIDAAPGQKRCAVHALISQLGKQAQKAVRRAERDQDFFGSLLAKAGAFGLEALDPLVARASAPKPKQAAGTSPTEPDPFAVLGLEKNCSSADVRARQRQLAAIFHPDRGGGAQAAARLAEINNAAAAVLKILRSK